MRVGLDLDGCVAEWNMTVRKALCKEFGYDKRKLLVDPAGEVPSWWWANDLGVSEEHWEWIWKVWAPNGGFRTLPPHEDAQTLVQAAKTMGDIVVVTARPKCAWLDTLYWLDKHDIGPPHEVHFLTDGHEKHTINCDVYIEDAPHYGMALQDAGMNVLMVARPYNDIESCRSMRRSAEDILEYANEFYRAKIF
jgi:hypothetical protein